MYTRVAPTTHVDVTHTPHTEFRPRQPRAHVSARRTAERIEGTRFFSSSPLPPFLLLALFDLSNRGSVCLAVEGRGGGGWVRSDRSGTGRISGRAIRVESRASFDALSLTRVLIAGRRGRRVEGVERAWTSCVPTAWWNSLDEGKLGRSLFRRILCGGGKVCDGIRNCSCR